MSMPAPALPHPRSQGRCTLRPRRARVAGFVGLACVLQVAWPALAAPGACGVELRALGSASVPAGTRVGGELFGGISGIDYDAARRRWYLVTDDRAVDRPPRFFVAGLALDRLGLRRARWRESRRLAVAGPAGPGRVLDAESLRLDPQRRELLVASEGDEASNAGPAIQRHALDGRLLGTVSLPSSLLAGSGSGPLSNRSIEGLALDPHSRVLWIALEAPLLQDGRPPVPGAGAALRLTRLDLQTGGHSQYVYLADPAPGHAPGESSDNGISEILGGLDAGQLLVLERSGIRDPAGGFRFRSRLYCAELEGATDVASIVALPGQPWSPVRKTLLLDLEGLAAPEAANFEAMSWGPPFAAGRRSLVLASDNNFLEGIATTLLVLEAEQPASRRAPAP